MAHGAGDGGLVGIAVAGGGEDAAGCGCDGLRRRRKVAAGVVCPTPVFASAASRGVVEDVGFDADERREQALRQLADHDWLDSVLDDDALGRPETDDLPIAL